MSNRKAASAYRARVYHRYLGFFLAGIMGVYALSGIVLIFRKGDTFKREVTVEKTVAANLDAAALGKAIRIKELEITRSEGSVDYFERGRYDRQTGRATYRAMDYPYVLKQMNRLHKATTNDPLYWLNISFGIGLLFFVGSAFWMYLPGGPVLRKGLYFTAGGVALTLLLLFV